MKFIKCRDIDKERFIVNLEGISVIDLGVNYINFSDGHSLELPDEEMQKVINVIDTETILNDSTIKELRHLFELNREDLTIFNTTWVEGYLAGIKKTIEVIGINTSEWGK